MIIKSFYRFLVCKLKEFTLKFIKIILRLQSKNDDFIVLRTDGGICSQIAFHALGNYFIDKGYHVKYDLTWFHKNGKDLNGIFDRNFDIQKAFPSIKITLATKLEIFRFKHIHKQKASDTNFHPPLYIDGYPAQRYTSLIEYKEYFKENFNPIDLSEVQEILNRISSTNSCSVHVRRGDLATYDPDYGYPADVDYFLSAINMAKKMYTNATFYFFSDEISWVREEIIPKLDNNTVYEICDKNGSEKGYLDLYLISKSKVIISSQGSFGNFAKILSNNNTVLITPKSNDFMANNFENVICAPSNLE